MLKSAKSHVFGAVVSLCFLVPLSASAAVHGGHDANAFKYNYLDIGYVNSDSNNEEMVGSNLSLSYELPSQMRLRAAYTKLKEDVHHIDETISSFGLGYHMALGHATDFVTDVMWLQETVSAHGVDATEDGYGLELGVRHFLRANLELEGALEYEDIAGHTATLTKLAGVYEFNHSFGLGMAFKGDKDTSSYSLYGQMYF